MDAFFNWFYGGYSCFRSGSFSLEMKASLSTPGNASWTIDSMDMESSDGYDTNSLLYLSGLDPEDAQLGDIYTELLSFHDTLDSCMNLLVFADMFLCILLGCVMASIFSHFWRVNK